MYIFSNIATDYYKWNMINMINMLHNNADNHWCQHREEIVTQKTENNEQEIKGFMVKIKICI